MSLYYKKLHDTIENLVQGASPIMNENFLIFDNYPPEKQLFGFSELHVINNDNEELDVLTTQALELALASILSVIKRQLILEKESTLTHLMTLLHVQSQFLKQTNLMNPTLGS